MTMCEDFVRTQHACSSIRNTSCSSLRRNHSRARRRSRVLEALFISRASLFNATIYYEALSSRTGGAEGRAQVIAVLGALGIDLPPKAFDYASATVKQVMARAQAHVDHKTFNFGPGHVHSNKKNDKASKKKPPPRAAAGGAKAQSKQLGLVRSKCPSVLERYAPSAGAGAEAATSPSFYEVTKSARGNGMWWWRW